MSSTCALNIKRKRTSNFSKEEELCLLEYIEKHKNIIENKTSNKISHLDKENVWLKILNEFNSKNIQTTRTLEQIKAKYDNLKTKARKEVAGKKKHIKQTGGGSPVNYDLDIVTQAILRIVNLKTVVGLENTLDNDATRSNVIYNNCEENTEDIVQDEISPIGHRENAPLYCDMTDMNPNIMDSLQEEGQTIVKEVVQANSNWSEYTPKKLKLKPNKKLRQMKTNTFLEVKQNFYKRKLELLETSCQEESVIRKQREAREKEEHEKKMRLLDMEIILKEKQLQEHEMK